MAEADIQRGLIVEANERFWRSTNYKPGQRLKQSDPADRRMMPVWMDFYRQVLREHTEREAQVTAPPAPPAPSPQPPLPPLPPLPPPLPVQPPTKPAEPSESSGLGTPVKALLVASGVIVAGLLGKFLYTEVGAYRAAGQIERQLRRSRR